MKASGIETLAQGDVFEILSNRRRRLVLLWLQKREDGVEVRKLTNEIAAMEHDTSAKESTSFQRKPVYVSLYQTHLPNTTNELE